MKIEKNLTSKLGVEAIINRIDSVTEKFYTNSNQFQFEGRLFSNEFLIYPTFDYGPNNQLRPEIRGKVFESENESRINLTFHIPQSIKLLLILALILNSTFVVFLYFKPIDKFMPWYFFVALIGITYALFYYVFLLKVKKSIKVIKSIIELA